MFERQASTVATANALAALIGSLEQHQQQAAAAGEAMAPGARPPCGATGAAQSQHIAASEAGGVGAGQGGAEAPLPPSLRAAAAALVQAANRSREQARLSARAALRASSGGARPAAGGEGTAAAAGQLAAVAASIAGAAEGGGDGDGEGGSSSVPCGAGAAAASQASSPPPPRVALAAERGLGHWGLRGTCGLACTACSAGERCLLGGGSQELWVCHPPPQQAQRQGSVDDQQEGGRQPRGGPLNCGGAPVQNGAGSPAWAAVVHAAPGDAAGAAAPALLRQQSSALARMRGGGEPASVGRAVPAVAVRRAADGALQAEPVLLFFGIIDFLQVDLRGGDGVALCRLLGSAGQRSPRRGPHVLLIFLFACRAVLCRVVLLRTRCTHEFQTRWLQRHGRLCCTLYGRFPAPTPSERRTTRPESTLSAGGRRRCTAATACRWQTLAPTPTASSGRCGACLWRGGRQRRRRRRRAAGRHGWRRLPLAGDESAADGSFATFANFVRAAEWFPMSSIMTPILFPHLSTLALPAPTLPTAPDPASLNPPCSCGRPHGGLPD
jgi:hypothetical protein